MDEKRLGLVQQEAVCKNMYAVIVADSSSPFGERILTYICEAYGDQDCPCHKKIGTAGWIDQDSCAKRTY